MTRTCGQIACAALLLSAGYVAGRLAGADAVVNAQAQRARVFELRTYTANEGKLGALHSRFRDHTVKLFEKHGMRNVGYWTPRDAPLSQNTLIYIVAHESPEAAKASWTAFRNDADWLKARTASEVDGKLAGKVESIYLDPTDYSPMK